MIAIIDYDAGNVKSVEKALQFLGQDVVLTRDKEILLKAEKVILPGVGAFGNAMEKLKQYGLVEIIHEIVNKGTPFLGICLGLQLMFESSEESEGVEAYDYIVVNDILEECVEEVHDLVDAARRAPVRRKEFIKEIREELKGFAKGAN